MKTKDGVDVQLGSIVFGAVAGDEDPWKLKIDQIRGDCVVLADVTEPGTKIHISARVIGDRYFSTELAAWDEITKIALGRVALAEKRMGQLRAPVGAAHEPAPGPAVAAPAVEVHPILCGRWLEFDHDGKPVPMSPPKTDWFMLAVPLGLVDCSPAAGEFDEGAAFDRVARARGYVKAEAVS